MLNKKSWFILIFLFFLFVFSPTLKTKEAGATNFIPQVTIPGSNFQAGTSTKIEDSTASIGIYIKSIYNYLLGIVGIVAAIVLMLAGVIWLTAGGSPDKVSQAKNLIAGSLTGLVLVLVSYVILRTINPYLVDFRDTIIPRIEPSEDIVFCVKYNEGEMPGELKDDGTIIILRTQADIDKNEKITKAGGRIEDTASQCKEDEVCSKVKYEYPNNIFECTKKGDLKCCQYEKYSTIGITCKTITNGESCPDPKESYPDIKLKYIYEGEKCDPAYNDSGRNPCVPGGKQ